MAYKPIQITPEQVAQFESDGFLILDNFLPSDLTLQLIERMNPLFYGKFETGIYPDE